VKTFKRICIEDWTTSDAVGNSFTVVRGKEYTTTSEREDGTVTVFSSDWVVAPVSIFAGAVHRKATDRPTVPDVLPLVREIYKSHAAGCCLHILTDDGNVADDHAEFCLKTAREEGHLVCQRAAEMLVAMTRTQRLRVYREHS